MRKFILVILIYSFVCFCSYAESPAPDILMSAPGSEVVIDNDVQLIKAPKIPWTKAIRSKYYDTRDTNVYYPKFLKACIDVYNWADKFFNKYNPDYVEGTGKRWKAMVTLNNWTDSYSMHFADKVPILMLSNPTTDLGINIQYMAVSLGYTFNMTQVIGGKILARNRFEFDFTCGLFSANFYYWDNESGTVLRRLGDYNEGHLIHNRFKGLSLHSMGGHIYYFLNNRKYAQGAGYNYSKIQNKSAGSFIFGLNISRQDVDIDFDYLPDDMKEHLKTERTRYTFDYNDYSVILGYGYNCRLGRRWLFNISALPSIGVKHSRKTSIEGRRDFFAANIEGKMAFVYNLRNFFWGFNGNFDGHWYHNGGYSFFNSLITLTMQTGIRF